MIYLLLFARIAVSSYSQLLDTAYVHPSIKLAVGALQGEGVDTLYVYHSYCSGCDNPAPVSEHCEGFIQSRVVWIQGGRTYTRDIHCDSTSLERKEIESQALDFYLTNLKLLTERKSKARKTSFLPPSPVHDFKEEFILIIKDKWYHAYLIEAQRKDKVWHEYSWIKPTIHLSDLNRVEMLNR